MKENKLIIIIIIVIIVMIIGVIGIIAFANSQNSNNNSLMVNNSTNEINSSVSQKSDYGSNSNEDTISCFVCGKPIDSKTGKHLDGTIHSDKEYDEAYVKSHEVKKGVYVGDDGGVSYSDEYKESNT